MHARSLATIFFGLPPHAPRFVLMIITVIVDNYQSGVIFGHKVRVPSYRMRAKTRPARDFSLDLSQSGRFQCNPVVVGLVVTCWRSLPLPA